MIAAETPPQMQAFRLVTKNDNNNDNENDNNENSHPASEVVHITVHPDPASGKDVILWDDIKAAFDDVIQVRSGTCIQSFLKGSDFKILEPRRIVAVPGVTLDVVVRDKVELSLESVREALPGVEMDINRPPNYETSVAASGHSPAYGLENIAMEASKNNDNPDSKPPSQGRETTKGEKSPETQPSRSPEEIAADAAKNVARTVMNATLGDPKALVALGDMYRDGQEVRQDYQAALDRYTKAANMGNADAKCNIGQLYQKRQITALDNNGMAMHWYTGAASQGHTRAKYNIGTLHLSMYRKQDKAASWFLEAANEGFAPAQFSIGSLHQTGSGVPQDYSLAMEWYLKASDQGHVESQYTIGCLYHQGHGVPQDYAQAMAWYLKAASQGYAEAQAKAGVMYQLGQGVPQDDALALKWCREAADQGNANSLLYLGLTYEYGLGVAVDKAEAIGWYKKAAGRGAADAKARLKALGENY